MSGVAIGLRGLGAGGIRQLLRLIRGAQCGACLGMSALLSSGMELVCHAWGGECRRIGNESAC
jgi:hypothetical protein